MSVHQDTNGRLVRAETKTVPEVRLESAPEKYRFFLLNTLNFSNLQMCSLAVLVFSYNTMFCVSSNISIVFVIIIDYYCFFLFRLLKVEFVNLQDFSTTYRPEIGKGSSCYNVLYYYFSMLKYNNSHAYIKGLVRYLLHKSIYCHLMYFLNTHNAHD